MIRNGILSLRGDGHPAVKAFTAKGGNAFNLYSTGGRLPDVAYVTPNNASGSPDTWSHPSFYDTDGDQRLPEPGSLALLGLGLLGIALAADARHVCDAAV